MQSVASTVVLTKEQNQIAFSANNNNNLLIVITSGPMENDKNIPIYSFLVQSLLRHDEFDRIHQMITFTVITLREFI